MEQATSALGTLSPLPVEIRLQIFQLVFQRYSKFIKPVRPVLLDEDASLDIALFVVSRKISEEAQDAFFDDHTIIITDPNLLRQSMSPFRHIEFRRSRGLLSWPEDIIHACSQKLKTVTLARGIIPGESTLRGYLESHYLDSRIQCLELGLFKVELKEGADYDILVKDFELCERLSKARKLAKAQSLVEHFDDPHEYRYDVHRREIAQADLDNGLLLDEGVEWRAYNDIQFDDLDDANAHAAQLVMIAPAGLNNLADFKIYSRTRQGMRNFKVVWEEVGEVEVRVVRTMVYARKGLLASWLAAYESFRVREAGQMLPPDEDEMVGEWYIKSLYQTHSIRRTHQRLPQGVKLQDLSVAQHGSEVVEWATELIGMNMRRIGGKPRDG